MLTRRDGWGRHQVGLGLNMMTDIGHSWPNRNSTLAATLNADRLVVQYRSGIGLLAKVDANVRRLAP